MKMLSVKTAWTGWQWVVQRQWRANQFIPSVMTSECKAHALGAEDLEYFREEFPSKEFEVREVLDD